MANDPIAALIQQFVSLDRQQAESSWNEIALIETLTKLLPGFSQEFALQRSAVEISDPPQNAEELAKLVSVLMKFWKGSGQ
jgi:hypothetical protein